jgi:hypothetical protein
MTSEERENLRRLAKAATPGPWEFETDLAGEYMQIAAFADTGNRILCVRVQSFRAADDAALIAAAHPGAVLALLDDLDAAQSKIDGALHALSDVAAAILALPPSDGDALAEAIQRAVMQEREECAKLALRLRDMWKERQRGSGIYAEGIAAAIRARGEAGR